MLEEEVIAKELDINDQKIKSILTYEAGLYSFYSVENAIEKIESSEYLFYVKWNGGKKKVIVSSRNGKKFLTTEPDSTVGNNLLQLPDLCFYR